MCIGLGYTQLTLTWASAKMTKMTNPAHPGELIREEVLPAFGLNIAQAAEALGVARPGFNNMVNGHRALSHEMALKVEAAFGVSAEMLIAMQTNHDLAQARAHAAEITAGVKRLFPIAA